MQEALARGCFAAASLLFLIVATGAVQAQMARGGPVWLMRWLYAANFAGFFAVIQIAFTEPPVDTARVAIALGSGLITGGIISVLNGGRAVNTPPVRVYRDGRALIDTALGVVALWLWPVVWMGIALWLAAEDSAPPFVALVLLPGIARPRELVDPWPAMMPLAFLLPAIFLSL